MGTESETAPPETASPEQSQETTHASTPSTSSPTAPKATTSTGTPGPEQELYDRADMAEQELVDRLVEKALIDDRASIEEQVSVEVRETEEFDASSPEYLVVAGHEKFGEGDMAYASAGNAREYSLIQKAVEDNVDEEAVIRHLQSYNPDGGTGPRLPHEAIQSLYKHFGELNAERRDSSEPKVVSYGLVFEGLDKNPTEPGSDREGGGTITVKYGMPHSSLEAEDWQNADRLHEIETAEDALERDAFWKDFKKWFAASYEPPN